MASIMAVSHTAIYVLFDADIYRLQVWNTRPERPCATAPPLRSTSCRQSDHTTLPRQCHHTLRRTIGLVVTPRSASCQPHGTAPCLRTPPHALPHPRTPLLRLTPLHHPTHALCRHGPALHCCALTPVHHPMPRLALTLRTHPTPPLLAMCHSHCPRAFAASHLRANTVDQSHATTNGLHRVTAFSQPCATANGAFLRHFPI